MFSWVYSLHYHLPHKEGVSKEGGGGGHTSISLTGMPVREQISTAQNNRITPNSNPQKIECPKIQSQKEIE